MYTGLLHAHSTLRWIVLILLVAGIISSLMGWIGKKSFTAGDAKLHLFLMISAHLQLVLGLVLYFISPDVKSAFADFGEAMKTPTIRFWAVEHALMMVLAIALITVGRRMTKKGEDIKRHKRAFWFYFVALLFILSAIPWGMRGWI